MVRPRCGWRYLVFDASGKARTVWGNLWQAKMSCRVGGCVKHEGTGEVLYRC